MNNPNRSIQNFVNDINFLLDEFAPHRKLKKHEIKLKTKPWITKELQYLMWERDKVYKKYHNSSTEIMKLNYYNHYKLLRNQLTSKQRESKIQYYKSYFDKNQQKSAALWKGIR